MSSLPDDAQQPRWKPRDVAPRINSSAAHVVRLCSLGLLRAVNISTGTKKPRWRISEAAVQEFLARRQGKPVVKVPRKRKQPEGEAVIEFF
jgi:hypothetical protein